MRKKKHFLNFLGTQKTEKKNNFCPTDFGMKSNDLERSHCTYTINNKINVRMKF